MYDLIDWFTDPVCGPADGSGNGCANLISALSPEVWAYFVSYKYLLTVVLFYLLVATLIGPWLMVNRCPIRLPNVIALFNTILSTAYFTVVCLLVYYIKSSNYSIWCQTPGLRQCGSSGNGIIQSSEDMIALLIRIFHVIKLFHLLEVLFLVFDKRRVPAVYIVHQVLMVMLSWVAAIFVPGGTSAVMVTACCATFPLLFAYRKMRGCHWPTYNLIGSWIQIAQLVFLAAVSTSATVSDCNYPNWASLAVLGFVAIFTIMVLQELFWIDGRFSASISLNETGLGPPWFSNAEDQNMNSK